VDNRELLSRSREASGYTSTDPAPPLDVAASPGHDASLQGKLTAPPAGRPSVAELRARLLDRNLAMFQRMRAVFALRNRGGPDAVEALAAAFADPSALLRHELAYVLGQMGDAHAVPFLTEVLRKSHEHVMVRHECAEALGAIGQPESIPVLQQFLSDPNPEVSESCEVALDLIAWVNSKDLDYAS
jgi:deoxyhypusine monooxygenase